jgi:flagellar basal-body rod protein FlgG
MIEGIYTSAASMLPRSSQQVIEADNVVNSNVPGHKRSNMFIRTLVDAMAYLNGPADQPRKASESEEVVIDFRQGSLVRTGDNFHVAIQGDGFFVVETPAGPVYTRGGQFRRGPEGELLTVAGYRVQGQGGAITIDGEEVSIQEDGRVVVDGQTVDTLMVVDFPKPYRLVKTGNNTFVPGNPADTGSPSEDFQLYQGYIESSNVQTVESMVNMITLERNYESSQKAIQYQDETLNRAVNDLGRIQR